ncbi:hypothetical protein EYF80_038550 [Liparis tanakae]|uniref:Uncharacterized protein n=1 Tax=Liparis tanakae TaxID=230148 RepID=A0A4Z2GD92_9TELE|nr:hypothetical protein EYF80_038550 [Liparis tanakae]
MSINTMYLESWSTPEKETRMVGNILLMEKKWTSRRCGPVLRMRYMALTSSSCCPQDCIRLHEIFAISSLGMPGVVGMSGSVHTAGALPLKSPCPSREEDRGLMVFSSVSLSLLGFPLDIRAAMEKAFARDESCGFGDEVYSMSCKKDFLFVSQ